MNRDSSFFLICLVLISPLSARAIQLDNTISQVEPAGNGNATSEGTASDGVVVSLAPNLLTTTDVTLTATDLSPAVSLSPFNDSLIYSPFTTDQQTPFTLNIAFDTSTASLGYTLSNIVLISGSAGAGPDNGGDRFTNQDFSITYTTFDNSTPVSLGSYTANLTNYATSSEEDALQSSLTSPVSASTPFAAGVADLYITFDPDTNFSSNIATYREIEVFGAASTLSDVPEPKTWALFLMAMVGLMVAFHRRLSLPV